MCVCAWGGLDSNHSHASHAVTFQLLKPNGPILIQTPAKKSKSMTILGRGLTKPLMVPKTSLKLHPLFNHFGAEVFGVDLKQPVDAETVHEIKDNVTRYV